MSASGISLHNLPEDSAALKALVRDLLAAQDAALAERDRERQRAEEQHKKAEEKAALALRQAQRADELYVENLRLQMELARFKKWRYGPRADRLSEDELAQALLEFGEELARPGGLAQKPLHPEDAPLVESASSREPEYHLRLVKRRAGRRNLANFENLPSTTQVYELSGEARACPCCGEERKEIGAEKSWQIDYVPGHFERVEHVRKKYACAKCEAVAAGPQNGAWTASEGCVIIGQPQRHAICQAGGGTMNVISGLPPATPAFPLFPMHPGSSKPFSF